MKAVVTLALSVAAICRAAGPFDCETAPGWQARFEEAGTSGVMVLLDARSGKVRCSSQARAHERFSPASTFKIVNTLLALMEGVASGPDHKFTWDGLDRGLAAWNQDQTLRSAYQNSTVWVYQSIARQVGLKKMQQALDGLDYGNRAIGGKIDQFWLDGTLKISALEQVEILRRLWDRKHGAVREILLEEETPQYRLFGKSGWQGAVSLPDAKWIGFFGPKQLGWYVGALEVAGAKYIFALNLDLTKTADAAARKRIALSILRDEKILP